MVRAARPGGAAAGPRYGRERLDLGHDAAGRPGRALGDLAEVGDGVVGPQDVRCRFRRQGRSAQGLGVRDEGGVPRADTTQRRAEALTELGVDREDLGDLLRVVPVPDVGRDVFALHGHRA